MFPFPDGCAFIGWRARDRVAEQIRRFSARDVHGYAALFDFLNRFAERLGVSLFEAPPTLRALGLPPGNPPGRGGVRQGVPRQRRRPARRVSRIRAPQVDARDARGHVEPGEPAVPRLRHLADDAPDVARIVERRSRARPRRQVLRGSTGLPLGGMGSIVRAMRRSFEAAGGRCARNARSAESSSPAGAWPVWCWRTVRRSGPARSSRISTLDDVSGSDRRILPGARVSRRGRAAAAARLGVQGGAGARRHPRIRRRAQGPGAGLRGMPVPDRAQHRVPGSGVRGREERPAVAGSRVLGAVPDHGGPDPGPAWPPHPERQRLPRAGRAARRELGDRARPVRRALHRRPRRVPAGVEGQDRRAEVLEPGRSGGGVRPARRQHHASRHDATPHVRAAPAGRLLRLPLPDRGPLRLRLLHLARRHRHRRPGHNAGRQVLADLGRGE